MPCLDLSSLLGGPPHLEGSGALVDLLPAALSPARLAVRQLHRAALAAPAFSVLLQRLLITATVTLMVVAIARWLVNPSEEVWLVYWRVQVVWLGALAAWSLLMRIALRRGLFLPMPPRLMLLASDEEMAVGASGLGRGGTASAP